MLTNPSPKAKVSLTQPKSPKRTKRYQKVKRFSSAGYISPLWASSAANLYKASGGAGWACQIFLVGELNMPMKMSHEKP